METKNLQRELYGPTGSMGHLLRGLDDGIKVFFNSHFDCSIEEFR